MRQHLEPCRSEEDDDAKEGKLSMVMGEGVRSRSLDDRWAGVRNRAIRASSREAAEREESGRRPELRKNGHGFASKAIYLFILV